MPTVTLTYNQRAALARKLGISDPMSLTPDDLSRIPARSYAAEAIEEIASTLDWAIGTGRIASGERETWEPRLRQNLEHGRAVLELLRADEELAEKAFHEDERLRALDKAHREMLGIQYPLVEYSPDERDPEQRLVDALHDTL